MNLGVSVYLTRLMQHENPTVWGFTSLEPDCPVLFFLLMEVARRARRDALLKVLNFKMETCSALGGMARAIGL